MSQTAAQDKELSPLKRALVAVQDLTAKLEAAQRAQHEPIAIVGLSCRFPGGANDPESFWQLLREGRHGVGEVPTDRWDVDAYYDPDPDAPGKMYTRWGGFLDRPVDRFDARFFEIAPREVVGMDPQQRLLLELAWEGLENAGLAPETLQGSPTGVFVGISSRDFGMLERGPDGVAEIDPYAATGSAFSVAAGRISHLLGLRGPTLALDTACSSSLVAVELAVQSLRTGRCDAALAGGVNLMLVPHTFIGMCKLRALAPDARCKTFDAAADGYVRGEGGGMVVLKRLSDALEAGDPIHAVIRGAAVNHDGRSSGLTVPNAAAQQAVIRAALADAGLSPEEVGFIEAHGTGTELGDPIEIRSLHAVLGRDRTKENSLALGSVKTNLGHLEAAAGIAGLIKLVLSLSHEAIPPHLHLERPTPHVEWEELPLVIPAELTPWPRGERPRIAGVSSFGFSGTNAHVLLGEAPTTLTPRPPRPPAGERENAAVHLLPLSARSPEALRELADRYQTHLAESDQPLADVCFTAAVGRNHFEHRLAVVGSSAEEMRTALGSFLRGAPEAPVRQGQAERSTQLKVAFLFTGHGAQYAGMGRQLFETEPVFRAAMEECDALLRPHLERPLLAVVHPDEEMAEEAEKLLLEGMTYSQPALFAIEYALAQLWRSWSIEPAMVLGHSVGEYAAAVIAGVFSLEDGLKLVAARGRLMDSLRESGAMVAVFAPEAELAPLLAPHASEVSLAVINAPAEVVISGTRAGLERVVEDLATRGIEYRWLHVAQAGHSHLLDPILDEFEQVAATVQYWAPRVPLISCTTADPVRAAEIGDPSYWRRHLRQPVRFAAAVARLHAEGCEVFVETGPHPTLLGKGQQCVPDEGVHWLPSLRRDFEDGPQILDSVAALYTAGARPDWEAFHQGQPRRRVVLPTYPFQGERYWPETTQGEWVRVGEDASTDLPETAEWLYQLRWQPAPRSAGQEELPPAAAPGHWLILADRDGRGATLAQRLRDRGESCTVIRAQDAHATGGVNESYPDPAALRVLVAQALAGERPLRGVIHLWSLDAAGADELDLDALVRAQTLGSTAVLHLVQALSAGGSRATPPRLWVVTRGAQTVEAEPTPAGGVAQAPLWGLGKTIALEHPELWGGTIDLDPSPPADEVELLLAEIRQPDGEREIAFRGGERQVARVAPAGEGFLPRHGYRPRPDGSYLITGGLGGLGLQVARWLAKQGARRLILLGRTPLPPRAGWKQVTEGPLAAQVRAIREMEALGASVHTAAVDVSDEAQLTGFLTTYEAEGWPPIRGVVHAAGLLRDSTLLRLDGDALEAALRPKVYGGWLLHRLLRDAPLDFFVLFSSAASLTGSAGQGNYAAANAFLDALALHRRGRGLPALSINWGPWAAVGMAARADLEERRGRTGMGAIGARQGVELLGRLLRQDASHVGVVPVAPARLRQLFPAETPWLAELPLQSAADVAEEAAEQPLLEQILAAAAAERSGLMLDHLKRRIARITLTAPEAILPAQSVMQLGMDSLMIVELIRALNRDLHLTLYPREIFERPSVEALAEYLLVEVGRATGGAMNGEAGNGSAPADEVGEAAAALPRLPARPLVLPAERNPRAVFLLSSPRSGSTLLRVMLAGHPELFCPPELHLLSFDGLAAWSARLDRSYFGEGLQRAMMELMQLDAEQSKALLNEWVAQDLPVHEVYRQLQTLASPRTLLDKTPSYAADLAVLERAELLFEEPRYIHLVRHPYAVIASFVRNRMEKLIGIAGGDPMAVAEQVWTETNSNTLDFLREIDPARHRRVCYEDLVTDPEKAMRELCAFLGISFVPELLAPYQGNRMADGIHASSLPIGDPNFHSHSGIDPALADAWRSVKLPRRLGGFARRVARELEYELPAPQLATAATPQRAPAATLPAIRAVPRNGSLPLSFAQHRLFFLEQLEPGKPTYNMPAAVRLGGALDLAVLEASFRALVQRHETLRTNLVIRDGAPLQEIAKLNDFVLPLSDLAGVPESERDTRVREIIHEEVRRPFALDRDLKLRARVIRLAEDEHVLVFAMHHVASDGWSIGILLRELAALYEAFISGKPSPLPELPVQYADYAQWQREILPDSVFEAQLAYWKRQLGELPVLELPTARPRPAARDHQGEQLAFSFSRELTASLKRLSGEEGVTLFMTILAAFQVLLHRYTRQEDIVVGTPIAGRSQPEITGLIGFFVNTLVMRTDVSGNPSFREALQRVRRVALDAYEHQELPFEKLVAQLQPERDPGRTPLFQVTCALQNASSPELRLPGLTFSPLPVNTGTAKFDLSLTVAEHAGGLAARFEYATDLFDPPTIARMRGHLETLLTAAVAHPDTAVAELPLLSETERHQLLVEWNRTERDFGLQGTLPELFEAQVARSPESPAVYFNDESLTYRQLDARANRLARHLQELGVQPETRVAISMERSLDLVVAMLATAKAGGAWVPIDPAQPAERVRWMLEDSAAPVLLIQSSLAQSLPTSQARVVCMDALQEELARYSDDPPARELEPGHLAYVIYTSGSTGRPKGALNTHAGICNRLLWMRETFGFGAADTFLHKATISFDVSVWEILVPLLSGARLVVARPRGETDVIYLRDLIEETGVSVVQFVPSVLRYFVEALEPGRCASLQHVFSGGEALSVDLQEEFFRRHPAQLHNLYGPTETAVAVAHWRCERGSARHTVPLGRPVANTQLYVLDRALRPVPIGIEGELHIGGVQVGRGYLNQPELTAERFIPDPFRGEAGARLYRTGDRARWLPDGTLEYLGRFDQQIKLRGMRLEPGEIESILASQPEVRDAAVVGQDAAGKLVTNGSAEQLLACLVLRAPLERETLVERLRQVLPAYMVPTGYLFLDNLPLAPSGKLDRAALATLQVGHATLGGDHVAPRTALEELLAGIWQELLRVERVGVHTSFFDVGGHSLLAMQLVSRIRDALRVELPLRALFEAPTIAQLAERVEALLRSGTALEAPPLVPVPREGPLPLSFAQQRLWFLHQIEPASTAYNLRGAARLRGPLDVAALERSFTEMVRRHESLRTVFREVEGEPRQVILPAGAFPLERVELRGLSPEAREEEVGRWTERTARWVFDLQQGPLLRAWVLQLAEEEHVLLVVMHHIVTDGWSVRVLLREVAALYPACRSGEPSPLPELRIQYADYASWQRHYLQGEVLDAQLAYWKEQLAELPPLELPNDRSRPPVQSYRSASLGAALPRELSAALRALSRREGSTLFMTLLAAFELLLARLSGQTDFAVGTPIANRTRAEVEPLIGFFMNTLVLRADLSGAPSFRELLARVRESTIAAYTRQELPFEKLVEELRPARDLSRTPLVQVLFNLLPPTERERVQLAELQAEPLGLPDPAAKFDFTLYVAGEGAEDEPLRLNLVYNTDLFEEPRMRELLAQYEQLLAQIADAPGQPITGYSLLTPAAGALLPNPAGALAPSWPGSLPARLAEQARRVPEQLALVDEQERWSYAELEQASNRLAHALLAGGVRKGDTVAVHAHRSATLVPALLGVLKAGAAFLILDPAYPAARLTQYLALAKPRGWLQLEEAGEPPPELRTAADVLPFQLALPQEKAGLFALLAADSLEAPASEIGPEDLAYVAFTSGTTGEPKGILGTHRPLSHFFEWYSQTFGFTEEDRFSALSGLAHDPLLRDLFAPLCVGAAVCIPSATTRGEPRTLLAWLQRERITAAHVTPAMSEVIALGAEGLAEEAAGLPELRFAFFGADVLTLRQVARLRTLAPAVRCVNFYGATETPQAVAFHEVTPEEVGDAANTPGRSVPLGRGIDGVQLLVLGESDRLCGVGEVGEICVRTPYLARGYLRDEALTRERFLVNPFVEEAPAHDRLYRTGDLGRYLPDGQVSFAGRADGQLKIRGHRIEPAEVEASLLRHPALKQAVVLARESEGERQLVAYLVATEGRQIPAAGELREHLRATLPEYMVPAACAAIEQIPLTRSGKVDRRALLAFDPARVGEAGFEAPGTPVELLIAGIWQELLGVERIGRHDNFFDLGGHSLLSLRFVAKLEHATGIRMGPREVIFQTLAQLAAAHANAIAVPLPATPPGFVARLRRKLQQATSGVLRGSP